jgi:hypothetical protein
MARISPRRARGVNGTEDDVIVELDAEVPRDCVHSIEWRMHRKRR